MESANVVEESLDPAKVLSAGSSRGHRVELLECPDGTFVITCDGARHAVYQPGACNLESCIKSFMAFLEAFNDEIALTAEVPNHEGAVVGRRD